MAEKVEKLNLVQKLAKIRSMSDVVSRDKKGYNYKYADITEILAKITAGMKKYEVSLIPIIVPGTSEVTQNVTKNTKVDKTGRVYENISTEMLVKADMVFRWINDEDPDDFIEVPWFVVGSQGDPSQAYGSGLTYCTRYFLTSFFQIAQPDSDVDSYRTKQREAEEVEGKTIAKEIIDNLDVMVREFLSDNPDEADTIRRFMERYVKDANYFLIQEPTLAGKLMTDFKTKFLNDEEE